MTLVVTGKAYTGIASHVYEGCSGCDSICGGASVLLMRRKRTELRRGPAPALLNHVGQFVSQQRLSRD